MIESEKHILLFDKNPVDYNHQATHKSVFKM